MPIIYTREAAVEKILAGLGTSLESLDAAQQSVLSGLPDNVPDDDVATAIQLLQELADDSQYPPADAPKFQNLEHALGAPLYIHRVIEPSSPPAAPADPLRARLSARLNAIESEHSERNRIIERVTRSGGIDQFVTDTIALGGAVMELRGLLQQPKQDKAA